jgi:acetyltransferase-like isoleucine patch superfamily enzyme
MNINSMIFRYKRLCKLLRIFFLRKRGCYIGKNTALGKITCDWPNKLYIGDNSKIEDAVDFRITRPFHSDNYIEIGNKVFIGCGCKLSCASKIKIGNDCFIACNSVIIDAGHEFVFGKKINEQPCTANEINIEDDVWIGTSCVILGGVTIGKGAVIGAHSLIKHSVSPYEVWGGNPAHFIKKRK